VVRRHTNDETASTVPCLTRLDDILVGWQPGPIRCHVVNWTGCVIEHEDSRPAMVMGRFFLAPGQGSPFAGEDCGAALTSMRKWPKSRTAHRMLAGTYVNTVAAGRFHNRTFPNRKPWPPSSSRPQGASECKSAASQNAPRLSQEPSTGPFSAGAELGDGHVVVRGLLNALEVRKRDAERILATPSGIERHPLRTNHERGNAKRPDARHDAN